MIYFSCDEWTNLLPCCPVRLICYNVTQFRLFSDVGPAAGAVPAGRVSQKTRGVIETQLFNFLGPYLNIRAQERCPWC